MQVPRYRNAAKQEYANRYAAWLASGRQGTEPSRPEGLSAMAAQAVRLGMLDHYRAK